MRSLLCVVTLLSLLFHDIEARADDVFHPSRVRLLVHGGYDITDTTRLEVRFVPAGNLLSGLAPVTFVGGKFVATEWLGIEAYTGWFFSTDEPLLSLTFNPHVGNFWMWTETDWRPINAGGYWFVQADYKLMDWLHAGVEGEGWGNWTDESSWSHGGGLNMLWRLGQLGTDFALHIRDTERVVKPEFFLRVHLFL